MRKRLPKQIYPRGIERDYTKFIRSLLAIVQSTFQGVIDASRPLLRQDERMATILDYVRLDNDEIERLLKEASAALAKKVESADMKAYLRRHAERTEKWTREQLAKQAQAAVGVDLFAGVRPYPADKVTNFVNQNVQLIKGLSTDTATRISKSVMASIVDGNGYKDLTEALQKDFGFLEDRALLIARDQTGKLYGQINADQQKEVGVSKFVWRTSGDDRVRPEHEDLDGETFEYPDGHPEEGIPGQAIQCRCHAEPVFEFRNQ